MSIKVIGPVVDLDLSTKRVYTVDTLPVGGTSVTQGPDAFGTWTVVNLILPDESSATDTEPVSDDDPTA